MNPKLCSSWLQWLKPDALLGSATNDFLFLQTTPLSAFIMLHSELHTLWNKQYLFGTVRQIWGQFQFRNWNWWSIVELELIIKKNWIGVGIDKFRIGIEVSYKINPQINLPINFLIQKYFFHDNPSWNINYSE